ncbi:MAG TPA: fatty acid oxidation complex subunit alpha FadJ [Gemmatimonadaceae bacterium]|nr:fatty acid oxidation complex subunit alpha FadJ [Gemmatimonadaceae bacterium]
MTGARTPSLTLQVENEIAIITFDLAAEPVNKFSAAVITEFDTILGQLERDAAVQAAVFISGKSDGFIAGADIDAFLEFRSAADAAAASALGHRMMHRLEQSRAPVVAAIHGACLGGGLEAALACAYRIATDHPKTVFAFPETQLGLIPGAGGTQRLPKRIGLRTALDMILTAKNVRTRKALQTGLVDEMVHPAVLRSVAVQRAKELATGTLSRHRERRQGAMAVVLEGNPVGRAVVFRQARAMIMKKSRGNYPALLAALAAVQAGYHGPSEHGYAEEARLFGEMAMTAASRELVFLFYATTSLKKDSGVGANAPAPLAVNKVGVIGTGFMGAGIAAVSVMQGLPVRFKDTKHEQVGRGLVAVRDVLKERLARRQITRQEFDDQLSLVSGTVEYTGFGRVPLVIEAVFEDLAVKRAVLAELEPLLPGAAIFASNTSTIPISKIAAASAHPGRVIGMHFFSPVHRMPLLEVIVTPETDLQVVTTAVAFGRKLGKTVIIVNDSPGFFANRILAPYINEAGRMLDEGVAIDAIDRALLDFGFPVGPITLLDEVGLDIAGKSGAIMAGAFGSRLQPSASLAKMLEAGRFGRKSKRGFYLYDERGKKGSVDAAVYALIGAGAQRMELAADEIQRRCALGMVNEAARCLEEGIVLQARDGDVGAVFGIGFPPFRGGPYRYVDAVGAGEIVRALQELDVKHPGRFAPCALLVTMAQQGKRFYPATGKPV